MSGYENLNSIYRDFLTKYVLNGGNESVLQNAFERIAEVVPRSAVTRTDFLDIHHAALRAALNIQRDGDAIHWLFIERATKFLAQMLLLIDALMLDLAEQVQTDPLTGVLNRIGLYTGLNRIWQEAVRERTPFTLLMLDGDDFKRVNDQWGHDMGDRVVRALAQCIRASVRDHDLVGRYGGDEFIIVLARADYNTAIPAVERLHQRSRVCMAGEANMPLDGIQVSVGAASFTDEPQDVPELIRWADKALYAAKAKGKGRTVFYKNIL